MIKLELTLDQVNAILNSLGQRPAAEVYDLISVIRAQGLPQVAELEANATIDMNTGNVV